MSVYRVDPISGSGGFKVQIADDAGGVRVVGVFLTEAEAAAWIAADSGRTGISADNGCRLSSHREG